MQQFHDGMMADNGDTLEAFVITNGVKQSCILAPMLFCLMFSAMLQGAFHHSEDGIHIIYQTDGKVKQTVIRDFLFVNDCAPNITREHDMQDSLDRSSTACNNFGLTIQKTEVMFQPAPGKPYLKPCITINDTVLNNVEKFTYLGSTISRHTDIDEEAIFRIAKTGFTNC